MDAAEPGQPAVRDPDRALRGMDNRSRPDTYSRRMPSYRTPDAELHYEERGTGEPVVVLGGGPARHPDYLGDLAGLSGTRTMVLPHPRGVAPSPMPDDPTVASWWNEGEDVEALRRHLRIDHLTVVAHSAGTRTAVAFAVRFPDSLARLVLITPPTTGLVDVESDLPAIRSRRTDEAFATALAAASEGAPAEADDDRLTAWQQAIAPLSFAAWGETQRAHSRLGGWSARAVRAFGSVDAPATFAADVATVPAPVRVIAAAEDAVVGLAGPLALADLFPDGRGSTIGAAGHYPWIDQPAAFSSALEWALTT